MSRYARRIDANHVEIMECLHALGAHCISTAALGDGFPDMYVEKGERSWLVEVKDGRKVPSARRLTPLELDFASRFRVFLVERPEDAAQLLRDMLVPIQGVPMALQGKEVSHA